MFFRYLHFVKKYHKITFSKQIAKVMPSIGHIETTLESEGHEMRSIGAGWLLRPNLLVSCAHCFFAEDYQLSKVLVKFHDGRETFAMLRFTDKIFDIAILELEKDIDAPIIKKTMKIDDEIGDMMILVGSSNAFAHSPQTGILCNKSIGVGRFGKYIKYLQINCTISGGASGGLLMNQKGVGVGMIQLRNGPFAFAIPIGTILSCITQLIKQRDNAIEKQQHILENFFQGQQGEMSLVSVSKGLRLMAECYNVVSLWVSTWSTTSSIQNPSLDSSTWPSNYTLLFNGCNYEHWLVFMGRPNKKLSMDEIIDSYIKILAQVIRSEEASMKIFSVSTKHYFAFSALVSKELSYKIKALPGVRRVLLDYYLNVREKEYEGEPFIDGQAVPYDPKFHEEWAMNIYIFYNFLKRVRPPNYD